MGQPRVHERTRDDSRNIPCAELERRVFSGLTDG